MTIAIIILAILSLFNLIALVYAVGVLQYQIDKLKRENNDPVI